MARSEGSIKNNLAALRQKHGLSAIELAALAGVTRQTVYAMESGTYVPNTAVALKLARALHASVEDIFALQEAAVDPPTPETVHLLAGSGKVRPGQPVQLCQVDQRLIASAPSPVPWHFPAADAVAVNGRAGAGKAKIQLFEPGSRFTSRILVAGCDPGISVLARHALPASVQLVLAHRNSSQALTLLKQGSVHVAGTHLRDEASGESNLPEISRMFPKGSVAVISFAVWEEGVVTAAGNPKVVRGVEDFARKEITIVNRERGSGTRNLLDTRLRKAGISPARVKGYNSTADGHLASAWQVNTGAADCCIATRAAARIFGLGFIPLASERYDLVVRKRHLETPALQNLLDVLSRSGFRRELESLGGYDARSAGNRLL